MKKWIILVALCIIGSPIYASVTMESVGDIPWVFDSNVTYNGFESLKAGSITDGESTSVVLSFTDVDTVELFVKTSTERSFDKLTIECNGSTYEYSGECNWESVWLDLDGGHTVTLTYSKDGSVLNGEDCCWVWFDGIDSLIFDDTDGSDGESGKKWEMSAKHSWYYYGDYTDLPPESESRPYIAPSDIGEGEESWISYQVEGTQVFPFKYLIISDESVYPLVVSVDGVDVASFGGRKILESYVIGLPDDGRHTIKWTYRKPIGTSCTPPRIWFNGIEDVVLSDAGFSMSMQYPWENDFNNGYEVLRSGTVFDGGTASFSVTITDDREHFDYTWKVSSEEEHDFLKVYRNNELINSTSGEKDWEEFSFEVAQGDVIKFEYVKDDNGMSAGEDRVWVWFDGIPVNFTHLFSEDEASAENTLSFSLNLNTGRDVQRGILDGDDGVSFASGEYLAWVHDENEGAMRSAEVEKGGESWMSAAVIGKGTFSFRWKSSGETLSCYVDGELKETLSGAADWAQVDISLENDARHEIKWVFARGEDSSDAVATGWVDGIVWNAPEGWDDPDEPIVPDTVSSFIKLDLRPSPRILEAKDVVEEIVYDPAWVNGAASAVLSIGGIEKMSSAESGTQEWTPGDAGEFEMKLVFKNASGDQIAEPLTASFKVVLDPLPQIGGNATAAEVAAIINGAADAKLKERVVDYVTYTNFCAWVNGKGVDHRAAMDSLYSWLSYALDAAGLILVPPKEGDLTIDGITPVNDGVIELEVNVKDISVGENATAANLKKVFDIEGAETLASAGAGFSLGNVEVTTAAPENGNVKFTVTPKAGNGEKPTSFFFRVKMK